MDEWNSSTSRGSSGLVDTVKQRATAQLESQKGRATDGLAALAHAARQTTQQLRSDQHDTVAQYMDRAAEQLERFSTTIQNKDVGELLREAQQLARRQPALFIGGSFVAGMMLVRFLKSSQRNGSGAAMTRTPREYGSADSNQSSSYPSATPGAFRDVTRGVGEEF